MKKSREMIEDKTPETTLNMWRYVRPFKNKVREDIRKHNLDEIRETIEASKSLKGSEEHTA